MTYNEMITNVDSVKPNSILNTLKLQWCVELYDKIKEEVFDTHEKEEINDRVKPLYHKYIVKDSEKSIDGNTNIDMPNSHLDVYEYYLQAKIDYYNDDFDKYSNSYVMFNNAYSEYKKWYNRTHMPL